MGEAAWAGYSGRYVLLAVFARPLQANAVSPAPFTCVYAVSYAPAFAPGLNGMSEMQDSDRIAQARMLHAFHTGRAWFKFHIGHTRSSGLFLLPGPLLTNSVATLQPIDQGPA